jgi:murein DD-endopeptidase MepM/ murein hydrolase activator NlpD
MHFGNPVRGLIGPKGKPDPASGYVVTQAFSETATQYGPHDGLDVDNGGPAGDAILAMADGAIYQAFFDGASGGAGIVRIDHGDGWTTGYAHMDAIHVVTGQHVTRGQHIGDLDSTGWVTGPHLHYDVSRHNVRQDPWPFANAPEPAQEGAFWVPTYGGAEFDHYDGAGLDTLAGARFRADTTTAAAILEEFAAGVAVVPHAIVKGQSVNGSDRWYLAWMYTDGRYRLGAFHVSTLA